LEYVLKIGDKVSVHIGLGYIKTGIFDGMTIHKDKMCCVINTSKEEATINNSLFLNIYEKVHGKDYFVISRNGYREWLTYVHKTSNTNLISKYNEY
jgi:hypothetical protein